MKKVIEFIQNDSPKEHAGHIPTKNSNIRACPSCGMMSIAGMPGGADSTCKNCGYKDPCCYD